MGVNVGVQVWRRGKGEGCRCRCRWGGQLWVWVQMCLNGAEGVYAVGGLCMHVHSVCSCLMYDLI
jgi:hypothetical protein